MFDGKAYWRFIHFFAYHNCGRNLLRDLGEFIDCQKCKDSYIPPDDNVELLQWSIDFHNTINAKLGKPVLSNVSIDGACDFCNNIQPQLLWIFTHNVAEAGGENAVPFLKTFNEEYPCDVCRGNIFPDLPSANEPCLYWTFRHRKRINDLKGIAPFIYEMTPIQQDSSTPCTGCPTSV